MEKTWTAGIASWLRKGKTMTRKKFLLLKTVYYIFPERSLVTSAPKKYLKIFTWQLNLNGEKRNFLPGTPTLPKGITGFVSIFHSTKKIPYGQNPSNARYRKEMSVIYG